MSRRAIGGGHASNLRIAEHYTDTAGATDHVFGLCHLLGFRFAPRIKDLKDRKLYTIEKPDTYQLLEPLIGDTVETAAVVSQWADANGPLRDRVADLTGEPRGSRQFDRSVDRQRAQAAST
jgi:TnpA family transposase